MKLKEFLKKNIAEIFWGITIAFLTFAFAFTIFGTSTNTNNVITASADSEQEILLPRPSISNLNGSYIGFEYLNDSYVYNTSNRFNDTSLGEYLYFDNDSIFYRCLYDSSYYIFASNNLSILDYGVESLESLVLLDYSDYTQSLTFNGLTNTYFVINLSNFDYKFFIIVYKNSSTNVYYPCVLFESLSNDITSIPESVIFDTTHSLITGNRTNFYNIVDYGDFKLCHINYNAGINGFNSDGSVKQSRSIYYYVSSENEYQEGYNSGYEEGYNNAMEEMQNANIQNPFKNRWQVNAYAIRTNNWQVIMNNADYEDVYGFIDNCIYNNLPVGAWAYYVNQNYDNISSYNLVFWANNVSEYFIDLSVNQILSIGQVAIVDDKATYTNEIRYDVSVKLSILNAGNNQTEIVSLNYLANDIINIDFTNINGVDYTYCYLKGVVLQFTNYAYLSNKYCIRFNNYGNGNYSQGYYQGYRDGSANANSGYMKGYNQGYADAQVRGEYTFFSLIGAVIDAPITYFTSLFNYEILGTNIKGFLLAMLTIGIVLAVIRISLAKK